MRDTNQAYKEMAKNNYQVVITSIDRCLAEPFTRKDGEQYYDIYVVGKTSNGEYAKKGICCVSAKELLDCWKGIHTAIVALYNIDSPEEFKLYFG